MDDKSYWESVYGATAPDSVSWYQPHASRSLALIRAVASDLHGPIVDVGGGASVLVDELLEAGYSDVTVLDLARAALAVAQTRLGPRATSVHWLEADVRSVALQRAHYAVWHDRAVFHFLTEPADRDAYVAQVEHAVRPGGHVLVATFAEDGPMRCSGLPVVRYSATALHRAFGAAFDLLSSEREEHVTPQGVHQSFVYCLCRRT
jgi:2-polyprenyl-3-methyl-5-hydroxy-6-metoxy-1,4-benzoquinol methylase